MAVVQYGAIVTSLKGSVGGQVFQGGNGMPVLRNKGYRKGSNTSSRNTSTNGLVAITTAWRSLSDSDRTSWIAAAASWPFTDRFGNTYYSNAYQCYVSYNRNLTGALQAPVSVPGVPASAFNPGVINVAASADGHLTITSSNTSNVAQSLIISASLQRGTGRNQNNVKTIVIAAVDMLGQNSWDVGSNYLSQFGQLTAGAVIIIDTVVRLTAYPLSVFKSRSKVVVTTVPGMGIGTMIIGSTFIVD